MGCGDHIVREWVSVCFACVGLDVMSDWSGRPRVGRSCVGFGPGECSIMVDQGKRYTTRNYDGE